MGIILFLIGAFAWRIRGQKMSWGDTVARFGIWGGSVGGLVLVWAHNPYYALGALIAAGIGAIVGYWGQFDFSAPGNWNIKNYLTLTATGMFRFTPLCILSICVGKEAHIIPAVLAGVAFVPVYMFAYKYLAKFTWGSLFTEWTCWAEFIFGGIIFTALGEGLFL